MAGRVRGFETVGDMVRSMAVVGAFIVVLLAITLRSEPDSPVAAVDTAPVIAAIEVGAPYAADVPAATPAGWTATSARTSFPTEEPYSWYFGYQTDAEQFVAVTQRFGDPDGFAEEVGSGGAEVGTVRIGGSTWTKAEREDGSRRSLTRVSGEGESTVTTIVVGTAPFSVLEKTAAALRPAK